MKKLLVFVLCTVMAVTILASVSMAGDADEGRTLNIAWTGDIETYDAHMTTEDYCIPINVFDRLFEIVIDGNGEAQLVNSLVTEYTVSEDGMTFDFTIRDDAKFSDGNTLTADDGEIPSPVNLPTGCYFHTRCPYATEECRQIKPQLMDYGGRLCACHHAGQF